MKKYTRLSEHLSNIADGKYWNSAILKRVIKSPLLSDSEKLLVLWFSKGIRYEGIRFQMELISIKLYVNRS
jgi:hypothetical protein